LGTRTAGWPNQETSLETVGNVAVLTTETVHHNVRIQAVRGQGGDKSLKGMPWGSRRREQILTRTRVICRAYALFQKGR